VLLIGAAKKDFFGRIWQQFDMPQVQLPIFPAGVTHINSKVAFEERDGKVYYFNGHLPAFVQEKGALASFRFLARSRPSMAMRHRRRSLIRGAISPSFATWVSNGQTLCEALPGGGAEAFFCTCQEALGQQIDCGSLPTGPRVIGPRAGGAGSGSATGDLA